MNTKILLSVLVLFSLLTSCNMPGGQTPLTQALTQPPENNPVVLDENVVATAIALTAAAQPTQTAVPATFTATASPTQCSPLVTATVNANVRSGPGTAYDIIGVLMLGQTAPIAGRNGASGWWYITYPGVAGGYAWISGTVVTSSCVPSVVQEVAAPPLPTAQPVVEASSSDDEGEDGGDSGSSALPDLVPVGISVNPNPATQGEEVHIQVGVKNQGNAPSGNFTMQWWATHALAPCSWSVASLAPGESVNKSCSYTYGGWNPAYDIKLVIDPGNAVTESNEGNNSMARKLNVQDAP